MPLQNRVTPFGELIAVPDRGTLMGNRGVLHDGRRRIVRFSNERRWISCLTDFRGRRRALMTPGRYTELFFLDEATALAAGHRPCWECRRTDALRFRAAWARACGREEAIPFGELDRLLHEERLEGRGRMRRWSAEGATLPDGTMLVEDGAALLVLGERLHPSHRATAAAAAAPPPG
jgi:hypothetical protein